MMDGVDQILQDFEKAVAAASAEAVRQMRAISARPPPVAASEPDRSREPPDDLISPGDAVHSSGLSRAHVHRLCTHHPIDQPGGFAVWIADENHFLISKSRFEFFLKQRPRRKRDAKRRKTKAKETL